MSGDSASGAYHLRGNSPTAAPRWAIVVPGATIECLTRDERGDFVAQLQLDTSGIGFGNLI